MAWCEHLKTNDCFFPGRHFLLRELFKEQERLTKTKKVSAERIARYLLIGPEAYEEYSQDDSGNFIELVVKPEYI
jgi:hypothetical protein